MAECVVTLHSVTSRNIHPCVSATHSYKLRNAPGALVYNPLGSTRWNSRLLSAKINARPQDLLSNGRKSSSTTWVASTDNSSQEPIQLPAGAEEGNDNISAEKSPVSPIEFASTLASAVGSDASSETELPTKKKRNRKGERKFYLLAAIASSIGFTTLSAGAVYYRFYWQLQVRIFLDRTLPSVRLVYCSRMIKWLRHILVRAVKTDSLLLGVIRHF